MLGRVPQGSVVLWKFGGTGQEVKAALASALWAAEGGRVATSLTPVSLSLSLPGTTAASGKP